MNPDQLCHHYYEAIKALRDISQLRAVEADFFQAAQYRGDDLERLDHLFKAWAGVSAENFAQQISVKSIRSQLEAAPPPHAQPRVNVDITAIDPEDIASGGEGLTILHHLQRSPFGHCLVVFSEHGICQLEFISTTQYASSVAELRQRWPQATLREAKAVETMAIQYFFHSFGQGAMPLTLWLKGTEFQFKVWRALLGISSGELTSYAGVAKAIGRPATTRAVANAIAANSVALIIPCHRVIHINGKLGEYRWGAARKMAMIGWESVMKRQRQRDMSPAKIE